jgi:hypothetical protein
MPLKAEYSKDVLAALSKLLAGEPDVQLGQMMGHPVFYYAAPGAKRKMFACVYGPGAALKLPAETIAELLDDPRYTLFTPMGRPMRGWLVAPLSGSPDAQDAEELVRQALDYVSQL